MNASEPYLHVEKDKTSVLILEDDRPLARLLESFLQQENYQVTTCHSPQEAFLQIRVDPPHLLLLDLALPPSNDIEEGLTFMARCLQQSHRTKIIIMTGEGTMDTAVSCLCRGAEDYIVKPVQLAALSVIFERTLKRRKLELLMESMRQERLENARLGPLIGESFLMQRVFDKIRLAAERDDNVLLLGESGTGKGVVAETIHDMSSRRRRPLVKVNCSALYEGLLESELFGHERGSFTGAVKNQMGKFEYASGGTLFLDEIGEIPPWIQAKLLHAVEDKQIQRIGRNLPVQVDTRIIAATNSDIRERLRERRFRQDLYYRLNAMEILLPPLRKRERDVQLLSDEFLREEDGIPFRGLSLASYEKLMNHDWPGNVRELRSVICRARGKALHGGWIEPQHLEIDAGQEEFAQAASPQSLQEKLDSFERLVILTCLSRNQGNVSRAARELCLTRSGLHKKILRLKIRKDACLS
jgi:two-component system, NtrC family, response regulator AtoC